MRCGGSYAVCVRPADQSTDVELSGRCRDPGGSMSGVNAAGFGYLLGGLAWVAVFLFWLRSGRALSARFVDHMYARQRAAPARLKWTYLLGPRVSHPAERSRTAFGMWLPLMLFAPVGALVFLASAVVDFRR
jgi:hypothetical protein